MKGKIPSLLSSRNGRARVVNVERTSKCGRCKKSIPGGRQCFEIQNVSSGYANYIRYCNGCFGAILEETKDLEKLIRRWEELSK